MLNKWKWESCDAPPHLKHIERLVNNYSFFKKDAVNRTMCEASRKKYFSAYYTPRNRRYKPVIIEFLKWFGPYINRISKAFKPPDLGVSVWINNTIPTSELSEETESDYAKFFVGVS